MLQITSPRPIRTLGSISLAAMFVAILGTAVLSAESARAGTNTVAAKTKKIAAKPLPREWKWQRKELRFDGMYRSR